MPNTETLFPPADAIFCTQATLGSVVASRRVGTTFMLQLAPGAAGIAWIGPDGQPVAVGTLGANVRMYVDGATGSDSNPGTQALPLRTFGVALSRLGAVATWGAACELHVAAGTYTTAGTLAFRCGIPSGINGQVLTIVGAFSTTQAGATTATATNTVTDTALAMPVNGHVGERVRFTSGAAAGTIYSIASNTATRLTLLSDSPISPAPGIGDTWVVEAPAVELDCVNFELRSGSLAMLGVFVNASGAISLETGTTLYAESCKYTAAAFTGSDGASVVLQGLDLAMPGANNSAGTDNFYAGSFFSGGALQLDSHGTLYGNLVARTCPVSLLSCSVGELGAFDTDKAITLNRNSVLVAGGAPSQIHGAGVSGILAEDGSSVTLSNGGTVTISGCGGSAVFLDGSRASLAGLVGTLNTGAGVSVQGGSDCVVDGGTVTVTGTAGDIEIGTTGAHTWAALGGAGTIPDQGPTTRFDVATAV
jgi:hypothetical protein